jgi:hypothetical protein
LHQPAVELTFVDGVAKIRSTVLRLVRKCSTYLNVRRRFRETTTPYYQTFVLSHPGCTTRSLRGHHHFVADNQGKSKGNEAGIPISPQLTV